MANPPAVPESFEASLQYYFDTALPTKDLSVKPGIGGKGCKRSIRSAFKAADG
jgi:hypothetical protein